MDSRRRSGNDAGEHCGGLYVARLLMEHSPVLLKECTKGLNINPDGIYVDGTLGRGGHSLEIAKRLHSGRIIAIDRDADAIDEASKLLSRYKKEIR